jgi:hypothetical protein
MFRLIHRTAVLVRMCPTFDLICEENTTRDGSGSEMCKLNSSRTSKVWGYVGERQLINLF